MFGEETKVNVLNAEVNEDSNMIILSLFQKGVVVLLETYNFSVKNVIEKKVEI